MVTLDSVTKKYQPDFWKKPFLALDCLSFSIKPGELVGYLGANGSGKTTSIKIMLQFIFSDSGRVIFDSSMGKNFSEIKKNIGYLPERPYLYPHLTGHEFLNYLGSLSGLKKNDIAVNSKRWSIRFGIDFALDRKLSGYSKGMLQRLGLVSTLIHNPQFIILDEPLSGLDPVGRKEIKDAIVELHKEGKTVFFSSHIVSDVEEICQSLVFIEKGKLVYEGPVLSLLMQTESFNQYVLLTAKSNVDSISGVQKVHIGDGLEKWQVDGDRLQQFLNEIYQNQISLFSLNKEKTSLEEILYKIKGKLAP